MPVAKPKPGLPPFDPTTETVRDDPYPTYSQYRERDPIHWREDDSRHGGRWTLFRHRDVSAALRSRAFARRPVGATVPTSFPAGPVGDFQRMISTWMLFHDDPEHSRMRKSMGQALCAIGGARVRPAIERICDRLLDGIPLRGDFDLVKSFALPLPYLVIAEIVGIPESEREDYHDWSGCLAAGIDTERGLDVIERAGRAAAAIDERLTALMHERRRDPREDMLSLLARECEPGSELEHIFIGNCVFLICAGHETTTSVIAGGVQALLLQPRAMAEVRAHPELAERQSEELLRFVSPVQLTARILSEDYELDGHQLRAGQHVDFALGSANRDPEVFADPDRFDPTRFDPANKPAPHLAFGAGPHACLGAYLARVELQVALPRLLARYPKLRLTEPDAPWRENAAIRGLTRLLVEG